MRRRLFAAAAAARLLRPMGTGPALRDRHPLA
ncbi:hypothetical protein SAMN05216467_0167 [Cellulomonas sp. KH9]|nr:hypothetical protein SAMN05216467_0167 [Cellulomonas sp. KH9]